MKSLIISPHPDDEVLGAGGTLFKKRKKQKNTLFWIIVTKIKPNKYNKKRIQLRKEEIEKIKKLFQFKKVFQLNFYTAELNNNSKKK